MLAREPPARLPHPDYRPDIDGLRAIAVLSVVIFHAFPQLLQGGFVGVDIFFVISGFLISSIILRGLETDCFSFVAFYARRIRRIFPSLILVLIFCATAGWWFLLADEYRQIGQHILGGAAFLSNFLLWGESGYFDNEANTKPLLHLWSLGIEEQFYLAAPFLMWLAWRRGLGLAYVIAVIAAASFASNVLASHSDPVADYYSPATRFWELLAGCLLSYVTLHPRTDPQPIAAPFGTRWGKAPIVWALSGVRRAVPEALSILGLILLLISLYAIHPERAFPGFWAILPVFAAVLIIGAGPAAWVNRALLSRRLLVWFGIISYPLYLWHWPLLSFAQIIGSGSPAWYWRMMLVFLAIALAWLTYRFVERPLRFGRNGFVKASGLLLALGAVGYFGYSIRHTSDLHLHLHERSDFLEHFENSEPEWRYFAAVGLDRRQRWECAYFDAERYRQGTLPGTPKNSPPREALAPTCYLRNPAYAKSVLLWGDSHAQQLTPGLTSYLPVDWQLLQVATSSCPPNVHVATPSRTSQCDQSNYFAMRTITEARPDVVVVAQGSGHRAAEFQEIAQHLSALGVKRIVIVGPVPRWSAELPKLMARRLWNEGHRTLIGLMREPFDENANLRHALLTNNTLKFADLISLLCNAQGCITYFGDNRTSGLSAWDRNHLTPVASEYVAQHLLVPIIVTGEQGPDLATPGSHPFSERP